MVKIQIKRLNPEVKIPSYKTDGSSGMDLMAFLKNPVKIKPKSSELISTGISIAQKILKFKLDQDLDWQQNQISVY